MQEQILDALRRGDAATALAAARAHAAEVPDDADAQRLLALALRSSGDYEGARGAIARAMELAPDDARLHLAQAGLLIDAHDIEGARASLQTAVGIDPNEFAAYIMQGHLAVVGNDLEEGDRLARLARRLAPEHPSLLALEGTLAMRRGDVDRAVQLLSRAIQGAPRDRTALHALGCAYLAKDHFAFAEQTFRRLLEVSPGSDSVRVMVAQLALRQGRPAEALAEVSPLLEDPARRTPQLLRFAGELETALGHPERALPLLREALAAAPADRPVLAALLDAWGRLGDVDDARRTLDALLATSPESDAAWRARLSLETGAAADAVIAEWRARRPGSVDAMEAEMTQHGVSGRLDEAEAVALALLEREPGHARAEMRVVDTLMARDPAAAAERLDRLIADAARPSDRQALQSWRALASHRCGDTRAALDFWLQRNAAEAPSQLQRPAAAPAPAQWPEPAAPAPDAPAATFMVGLPGALPERVARLLAPVVPHFRSDRFWTRPPADGFQDLGAWPRIASGEVAPGAVIDSWRAALPGRGIQGPVIDWLPWWDNVYAAAMRAALPGARLLVVLRDPRDMLVDWLAFGAQPPFAAESPQAAADWLAGALGQLATVHEQALVAHDLLRVDDTIDDPVSMAAQLGDTLGIRLPEPPAGYFGPRRQSTGIWRSYADLLAGPIATMAPVARRFGYPD